MWQRIQTLYLFISTSLTVVMFFAVMALVIGEQGQTDTICFSEKLPYLCLMISISCAHLLSLVLFKFRPLQLRVTVIAALLSLGFQIWLVLDCIHAPEGIVFKLPVAFPAVCFILDLLAAKGIYSDQLMVESFSRLRPSRKRR